MPNFDGEYEIRIFYTTVSGGVSLEHRHTFDVQPVEPIAVGAAFADIYASRRDGSSDNALSILIDEYIDLIKPLYKSDTNFVRAELWQYGGSSLDASYKASYPLGVAGDSANSTVPAQQVTVTFRTLGGYILRLQLMESVVGGDTKDPYPFVNVAVKALADYVISDQNFVKARDNTFPIVALNASYGANEKLWRKRFRPS